MPDRALLQQIVSGVPKEAAALASLAGQHWTRIGETHLAQMRGRPRQWAEAAKACLSSPGEALLAYAIDGGERSLLALDVLRRRGNTFIEHDAAGMPPVLDFDYDRVVDGTTLPRPVNCSLVRIAPPKGVAIDARKRPFMIVDPRAGHGAGIGGFKPESQVGEAFEEGHAVYFVVFKPFPEPGQTLADVRDAKAAFLDEIANRHPQADKPVIIGNCQGGWGSMLLAAGHPSKAGPLAINGAPMAYWAGQSGRNPMRYLGGLSGGVVPAMLLADLGNGVFDGSLLVQNFETLNPANTYWKKLYGLYSGVDSEAERFLEFERWWGGFFMMNEEEIRWIVETLFIGNRLAHGQAYLGGSRVDLTEIRSPILIFASHGDNITPPPQALNWVADCYRDVAEIKARGQRIVYLLHKDIGHLGIFVSAKVAGREHDAITDTMAAIEALPPGLYEMLLENEDNRVRVKFAPRTIDDLLSHDDGRQDEEMFAAVAKLSEVNAKLYETYCRPFLRAITNEESARAFFDSRPMRLERAVLSDRNPAIAGIAPLAEKVRQTRRPIAPDNPYLAAEKLVAASIEQGWNLFRDLRDAGLELTFHAIYGSPLLRFLGRGGLAERREAKLANLANLPEVRAALADIETGGEAEGMLRMLELMSEARGYVRRSRLEKMVAIFENEPPFSTMSEDERAAMIHRQALVCEFAPDEAKSSLPKLLDTETERRRALDFVLRVAGPAEAMHPEALALYREFETMLGASA